MSVFGDDGATGVGVCLTADQGALAHCGQDAADIEVELSCGGIGVTQEGG